MPLSLSHSLICFTVLHLRLRCLSQVVPKPCKRFPVYQQIMGTSVDVGRCKGECHWKKGFAYCRPLTFETQTIAPSSGYGKEVAVRTIDECGCSNCRVKARYRMIKIDSYNVRKVNVGYCDGMCGPDTWPEGQTDYQNYWTTECQVAATRTLVFGNIRYIVDSHLLAVPCPGAKDWGHNWILESSQMHTITGKTMCSLAAF